MGLSTVAALVPIKTHACIICNNPKSMPIAPIRLIARQPVIVSLVTLCRVGVMQVGPSAEELMDAYDGTPPLTAWLSSNSIENVTADYAV